MDKNRTPIESIGINITALNGLYDRWCDRKRVLRRVTDLNMDVPGNWGWAHHQAESGQINTPTQPQQNWPRTTRLTSQLGPVMFRWQDIARQKEIHMPRSFCPLPVTAHCVWHAFGGDLTLGLMSRYKRYSKERRVLRNKCSRSPTVWVDYLDLVRPRLV